MFSLKDLLAVLDAWPKWKRIQETLDQLAALEKRVAGLESRLARARGDACPKYGEMAFRVQRSEPDAMFTVVGGMAHYMKCEEYGFEDKRMAKS